MLWLGLLFDWLSRSELNLKTSLSHTVLLDLDGFTGLLLFADWLQTGATDLETVQCFRATVTSFLSL